MDSKIAEVVINSMPAVKVIGHPFWIAIIGGITGAFISLIGVIGVHKDSKRMWRNEIFIKKMQTELVEFYDKLSLHIGNEYDMMIISEILNNEFDYSSLKSNIDDYFKEKLELSKKLETQFAFIQPVLEKCLKIKQEDLFMQLHLIGVSTIIYGL